MKKTLTKEYDLTDEFSIREIRYVLVVHNKNLNKIDFTDRLNNVIRWITSKNETYENLIAKRVLTSEDFINDTCTFTLTFTEKIYKQITS